MRITIVYDNEALEEGLYADWGFSCLLDLDDRRRMLFDTGARGGLLLQNMSRLGIDPSSLDEVFLSHSHWDHTGGLEDLLEGNPDLTVYAPVCVSPYPRAANWVGIRGAQELHENVYSTGELRGIEQSLVVKTKAGIAVITGCSHPGIEAILNAASEFGDPYALIGGFHGFRDFSLLEGLELVCPCHCTQFKREIQRLAPEKCTACGAGKVLEM
jgi:7,8-dihydropterin-6-yl-methyl-4-(beta-D-ribofuranosyl)aminobenzene 5'-phosphate synthase